MRHLFSALFLLLSLCVKAQPVSGTSNEPYNFDKKYTILQLRSDFSFLRETLEAKHPRLYEYTPKKKFDHLLDSLYSAINTEMTEREFQFFLLPVIGMVHCSHTKLMSSQYLLDHMNDYCKAPPFQVYFTNKKAYIVREFGGDTSIAPGAELLSVNNIPIGEIRRSFLARMPQEGHNTTFVYNRMNTGVWLKNGLYGLFPGLCDYPVIDSYQVSYINPGAKTVKRRKLASMAFNDYPPFTCGSTKKMYGLRVGGSTRTAVLTISSFLIPFEDYQKFIDSAFTAIRSAGVNRLIIDVRGNIGGIPEETVELLAHIMHREFVYFKQGKGYDEYKSPTPLAVNRFKGKVFFLIDGGCRSSTGHFLAIAKCYHLGPMIGEEACASYSCNDNGSPYTLPNTKLIFQCPASTYAVAVSGLQRGRGIMPDHTVTPTINDMVAGRDPALQLAQKMAAAK